MSKTHNKLSFAERLLRQSNSCQKYPQKRTAPSQTEQKPLTRQPKNHYVNFKQTHNQLKNMLDMLDGGQSGEGDRKIEMHNIDGLDELVQPPSTARRRLPGKTKTYHVPEKDVKKKVIKQSIWEDSLWFPRQRQEPVIKSTKPKIKEGLKMWSSLVIPKTNEKHKKEVGPDPETGVRSPLLATKNKKLHKKEEEPASSARLRPASESKQLKFFRKEDKSESFQVFRPSKSVTLEVPAKKGIPNRGNTCYINALVQCLFHLPHFNDYIVSERYKAEARGKSKGVVELYRQLYLNVTRSNPDSDLSTLPLKRSVSKLCHLFMTWEQQDAHQFMKQLLNSIHDEMNRIAIQPKYQQFHPPEQGRSLTHLASAYWKESKLRDDSYIYDSFCGQIYCNIKCNNCCHQSQCFENFLDLSLPMNNKTQSLEKLLSGFFEPQKLADFYSCNQCGKSSKRSTKQLQLWKAPKFLIIHLKRSQFTKKNTDPIQLPERLTLQSLMTRSDDRSARMSQYNLSGIIMHQGVREGGHNWSVVKQKGKWYELNDQKVRVIGETEMSRELKGSRNAYILFYASLYA